MCMEKVTHLLNEGLLFIELYRQVHEQVQTEPTKSSNK